MHSRAAARALAVLALTFITVRPVAAQTLTELLSDLFVFGECGVSLCMDPVAMSPGEPESTHAIHFRRDLVPQNDALLLFVEDGISGVVGSLPATAMAGGPIWSDGVRSASLGPVFAERAETLGMGRFFLGLEATGFRITNFGGTPTDDLLLNFFHHDTNPPLGPDPGLGVPAFERDVLQVRTNLAVDYVVATGVVSAGLTSFIDVGVLVPVVRARLEGTADAQILPFDPASEHRFGGSAAMPVLGARKSVAGTSIGMGDVTARVKVNLSGGTEVGVEPPEVGIALVADYTFPTGQEEDLLGTGEGRGRALAVLSRRWGDFASHVNAGFLVREENARDGKFDRDALLGSVGFDVRVTDDVTVAAQMITHVEMADPDPPLPGPVSFAGAGTLTVESSSLSGPGRYLLDLATGLKYQVRNDMVLVANALLPIQGFGLRPDFMFTLGLQGTFR
ncbi:hypothetical protein [Candidatus Palauibacter sp.]|uniref:hypothetical protein n=1 Tax=Candidatus Palauibacter sp. TaxID=3101350 RepID=UPI003B02085A